SAGGGFPGVQPARRAGCPLAGPGSPACLARALQARRRAGASVRALAPAGARRLPRAGGVLLLMPLAVRLGPRTSWLIGTCLSAGALSLALVGRAGSRTWFLPGPTTHGHHQIELSCQSCHSSAFA